MRGSARFGAAVLAGLCFGLAVPGPVRANDYRAVEAALDAWRPERAEPLVARMQKTRPDDPMTQLAVARLRFEQGRYDEAVSALDQLEATAGRIPAYRGFSELVRRTQAATADMRAQRSARVEVRTVPGPDEMLAPFVLETMESALDALARDLGIEVPQEVLPLRVEIYPDVSRFVDVSTLTREEVETSGTVALCKFHRMMIVSPRRLARGYRWRDTLTHELVHFLLSRGTDNRLPLWLHEGVAKYLERRWSDTELGALHPIQASILAEASARDVWVPFADMMPSLAKLDSGWKTSLAFAEVTLLVAQIVEDGGLAELRRVIGAFAESPAAGYAALGVANENELWDRFLARVKTTEFQAVPGYRFIPPSVAESPEAAEPEPIGQARARKHTRVGDLLRVEGRWKAAIEEYAQAEALLGYVPAPLSLKRAEAWMLGARYDLAEAELRKLLVRDPDRATAHWLLGKIALFRRDAAEALQRFETAFGITPFHDDVLEGLAEAARRAEYPERARLYAHAREVWHVHRSIR